MEEEDRRMTRVKNPKTPIDHPAYITKCNKTLNWCHPFLHHLVTGVEILLSNDNFGG